MSSGSLPVWPVAQVAARSQRRERHLAESTAHPGNMLPELARQTIEAYSKNGGLVVDPMCGIGTTLVEAIHLGRRAVGVELEPRWASLAASNICLAREQGAAGQALVIRDDARRLGHGLLDQFAGQTALILSSPPYGPSVHGHIRLHDDGVETFDDSYSDDRDNLARLPPRKGQRSRPAFRDALADILGGCRRLLKPGGRLVLTARPYRRRGALIDLPGELIELAQHAGLRLEARKDALLCSLRADEIVPHASFFQTRHQRSGTIPRLLVIAHEDVLVFVHARAGKKPRRAAPPQLPRSESAAQR